MSLLRDENCDAALMSPLTLAFVGDAVYGLLVREALAREANRPANDLHAASVSRVCAAAQAHDAARLMPVLTEEELAVYKRGRNAHANHLPRNASPADYHAATGFEALFGYLYLQGRQERLRELFEIISVNP